MLLDILIVLALALFGFIGWRRGFLRGLLGFTSAIIAATIALFTAKPIASLFGKANFIKILICLVAIYIIVRILLFLLAKCIKTIKEKHAKFDKGDKIAGIFLGVIKCLFGFCMICASLYLLTAVPFMEDAVNWIFKKSYIGKFIYRLTIKILVPVLGKVNASSIFDNIFG